MSTITTKDFSISNAINFEKSISNEDAFYYVMIGRSIPWSNTTNPNILDDTAVDIPYDTVEYKNETLKKGIVLKRINNSDVQPVVPRVDWSSGAVYAAYDQSVNLYLQTDETPILGGNVNVTSILANTVVANGINLALSTPSLVAGDFITIGSERKEVVSINIAGDFLQVNSNFSSAYTSNLLYKFVDTSPQYANKFYVRNNSDQVFKCLFNNNSAPSTIAPEITIGGQLPENPFIETADGYKWKYMYTIPGGLKSRFFNDTYMPVIKDNNVVSNAENGRIDIVEILDGGSGYFQGSSQNNYSILAVIGDGTGADLRADVTNGVITEIEIINGGSNYTTAEISIVDPLKIGGTPAVLRAIIGPKGGHGSDPVRELGASNEMISVDLQGDLGGALPTKTDGSDDFRQIAIVKNPKLANGAAAIASVHPMYTLIYTDNPPPGLEFTKDTIVYVGDQNDPTFLATVIHFDDVENVLYVNDPIGDVDSILTKTLYEQNNTSVFAQVFSVLPPSINILSGDVLYIENKSKIVRSPSQTETVKIVVEF